MSLNILIIGAGVCGPALALLLTRSNPKHTITVIERHPSVRTGGQQIDLKEQGIPIMEKMGLLETIRSYCVNESGMEVVDTNGRSLMRFGVTPATDKPQSGFELTNEFEFMRGDMVKMFVDASEREGQRKSEKDGCVKYEFGKTITALDHSSEKSVTVTFSDNETRQYDLVVAADGQGSRTRRLTFGEKINDEAFQSLGIHAAYYNIPRLPSEDSLAKVYFAPKNRIVMTRTGDRPLTQVYFFLMKDDERAAKMKQVHKQPVLQQKEIWTQYYATAGWECKRLLADLTHVDDFYACEIAQVKMPQSQLHKNRLVLLGDAGYCPSPFTGMGTTLSLIGAYVLAGELARHPSNVDAALQAYSHAMQQPIEECQKLPLGVETGFYPSSELGVRIANSLLWAMARLRIDRLMRWVGGWMPGDKGRWTIPEYPELNVVRGAA